MDIEILPKSPYALALPPQGRRFNLLHPIPKLSYAQPRAYN